jgi:hypothetical protein
MLQEYTIKKLLNPASAVVAGDEVQTVLSLVQLGVGRFAGLACDVFN